MKMDEEFEGDRVPEIETDDEDNEAERDCDDDDTDSDKNDDTFTNSPSWPRSYRKSMDMYFSLTPTSTSYLTRSGSYQMPHPSMPDSHFTRPLLIAEGIEVPESTLPTNLSETLGSRYFSDASPSPDKCSLGQSLLNAINALCGIGILSTPYALKEGGWYSLLILIVLGIITCYTGILLQRCLESSPGIQTYPDIGQASFGLTGRVCIAIILYIELYSSCVEYLIMMSDNLADMFPNASMDFAGLHLDSFTLWTIISTLLILPTVWLRDLSLLSYISAGGVVTLFLVVVCLLWVGTVDGVGFHPTGSTLNLAKLPVTIGLYSFCYGSHSVFPNIYSSMKEPSKFPIVLVISFIIACIAYAGVAISGFLMFGDSTKPQFTLNLPSKFAASNVAGWTVVVAPITKYALTITPVALGLEELLPPTLFGSYGVSLVIRSLLVISTMIVALTVPYFGTVMALIGSLLVMLVALVIPCSCYMKLSRGKLGYSQVASCILIIIVGVVCAVVGTYAALTGIPDQNKILLN